MLVSIDKRDIERVRRSQPDQHLTRTLIYLTHQLHLTVTFMNVCLVDTYLIDPNPVHRGSHREEVGASPARFIAALCDPDPLVEPPEIMALDIAAPGVRDGGVPCTVRIAPQVC